MNNNNYNNARYLMGWQIIHSKGKDFMFAYFNKFVNGEGAGQAPVEFTSKMGRSASLFLDPASDLACTVREIPIGSEVQLFFNEFGRCVDIQLL